MKLNFALALNHDGVFELRHFGDADKFAFYTESDGDLHFVEEAENQFKTLDNYSHGSPAKGKAIISFLNDKYVDVLVSKQFGKNISLVSKHFIPVIIHEEKPADVLSILNRHKEWFKDELTNRKNDFMLFQIKNGILKSKIKAD